MTRRFTIVIGAIVACLMTMAAAPSGERELSLLKTYIGDWRGEGVLTGGESPEPFRCRLKIAKGNASKINYAGRCTLIDMNLSVSGTIAFNEEKQRYEAAMSSNAGFTGLAVGHVQNEKISFDLTQKQVDRAGSDVRIGSRILLVAGQITVDFEVEFNNSGQVLTASVPFSQ
jgi:hypothetical protein